MPNPSSSPEDDFTLSLYPPGVDPSGLAPITASAPKKDSTDFEVSFFDSMTEALREQLAEGSPLDTEQLAAHLNHDDQRTRIVAHCVCDALVHVAQGSDAVAKTARDVLASDGWRQIADAEDQYRERLLTDNKTAAAESFRLLKEAIAGQREAIDTGEAAGQSAQTMLQGLSHAQAALGAAHAYGVEGVQEGYDALRDHLDRLRTITGSPRALAMITQLSTRHVPKLEPLINHYRMARENLAR